MYNCLTSGISAGQGSGVDYLVAPWVQWDVYDLKARENRGGLGLGSVVYCWRRLRARRELARMLTCCGSTGQGLVCHPSSCAATGRRRPGN